MVVVLAVMFRQKLKGVMEHFGNLLPVLFGEKEVAELSAYVSRRDRFPSALPCPASCYPLLPTKPLFHTVRTLIRVPPFCAFFHPCRQFQGTAGTGGSEQEQVAGLPVFFLLVWRAVPLVAIL